MSTMTRNRPGTVLFELIRVGSYVKVSAVDENTGTEVSIVGDPKRSTEVLKQAALRRLRYVMEKERKKAES
jgi:hypothetical protein